MTRLAGALAAAAEAGAALLVTPEMYLSGYAIGPERVAAAAADPSTWAKAGALAAHHGIILCLGGPAPAAEADGRPFERVRAALVIDSAQAVQARGVDPKDKDQIISVLSMSFEPASDQEGDVSGTVILTLAGDGEIAARVECLDIRIMDMSQPWAAPSGR
ncbi:MAG: DUF2948 family protein, partial [Pseudomonadota bacterium]